MAENAPGIKTRKKQFQNRFWFNMIA